MTTERSVRPFGFVNHLGQRIYCNGSHTYVAQPGSISASRIPDDQQWFWTPEWQDGEREADEDIASGNVRTFTGTNEELLAWLDDELCGGEGTVTDD